jgi:hypothetical protein
LYDIWFVNGHRVFGTFQLEGAPPDGGPGGGGGGPGSRNILPVDTTDSPLRVRLEGQRGAARTYHLEHGALLLQQGDQAVIVSPPPFAFSTVLNGGNLEDLRVTLRLNALQGPTTSAGTIGTIALGSTLMEQLPVKGTSGNFWLNLSTASCGAWRGWFDDTLNGTLSRAGLAYSGEYGLSCPGGDVVSLKMDGPERVDLFEQDLLLDVLWTSFRVEVVS